jgi:hypothetical protein
MRLATNAVALCVLVMACQDAPAPRSVVGDYALTSAGGEPLPRVLFDFEGSGEELLGADLHLNADGSFLDLSARRIWTPTTSRVQFIEITGTFTQDGFIVRFQTDSAGSYNMAAASRTLTANWNGLVLVYTRE